MRGYTFTTCNSLTRDMLFEAIFKAVKDLESFALRDVILNRWENKGLYCAGLTIADETDGTIFLVCANEKKAGEMTTKVRLDSDFGPDDIIIPNDVNISITWRPDGINRYKIVKQNHDKIIEMIKGGSSAEEIGKTFGIPLTEEECRKLAEKEK